MCSYKPSLGLQCAPTKWVCAALRGRRGLRWALEAQSRSKSSLLEQWLERTAVPVTYSTGLPQSSDTVCCLPCGGFFGNGRWERGPVGYFKLIKASGYILHIIQITNGLFLFMHVQKKICTCSRLLFLLLDLNATAKNSDKSVNSWP